MVPVNSPGTASLSRLKVAHESPVGHESSTPLAKVVYSPAVMRLSPLVRDQIACVLSWSVTPSGLKGGWVIKTNPLNSLFACKTAVMPILAVGWSIRHRRYSCPSLRASYVGNDGGSSVPTSHKLQPRPSW